MAPGAAASRRTEAQDGDGASSGTMGASAEAAPRPEGWQEVAEPDRTDSTFTLLPEPDDLQRRFAALFATEEQRLALRLHEEGVGRKQVLQALMDQARLQALMDPAVHRGRSEEQHGGRQGPRTRNTPGQDRAAPALRAATAASIAHAPTPGLPSGQHGDQELLCPCNRTLSRGGGRLHQTCCARCPVTHAEACERWERRRLRM